MTADEDTDTESVVDGEIFDPDIHEEFFDCSGEAYDYDDASDSDDDLSDIPELIPRGRNSRESKFPPPLKDYKHRDSSIHPIVAFNKGRDQAYDQYIEEVDYFCNQVGMKGEGTQQLFDIEFGEHSELYAKFKRIGVKSFGQYCLWLATFFLECRFSVTYERLVRDPDVNTTSYMDADEYKAIWRKLENYNRQNNYSLCSWEMIESALNSTLHDLFVPQGDEFKMRLSYDDDKQWYNFFC